MKVIPPVPVTTAMLASSIGGGDYPEWSPSGTYATGLRVTRDGSTRIFESAIGGNTGNDPLASTAWIDAGPVNRWAMFDQAIGSVTTATDQIGVILVPGVGIGALALLDLVASSVTVAVISFGTELYEQTRTASDTLVFLDLPLSAGAEIHVNITGAGTISVGTLIIGNPIDLGSTETSPTVGISDFSRRETDEFGITTVVERSWSKTMSLRTMIDTSAVDGMQRQVAAVRAKPSLWIGEDGFDSLAIYGFFKDFSIDLALETKSYCTLTIEGLTTAGAVDPAANGLAVIFQNAATQPVLPGFNVGLVPTGWTSAPLDLPSRQFRWSCQAEFRLQTQVTPWTSPVTVAGQAWVDIIDTTGTKPDDSATRTVPVGDFAGEAHLKGDIVISAGTSYIALVDVPAGSSLTNGAYWKVFLPAPAATPHGAHTLLTRTVAYPLTSDDSSITIAAFTGVLEERSTITFPAGSVTGLAAGTYYNVFRDLTNDIYVAAVDPALTEFATSYYVSIDRQATSSGGTHPAPATPPSGYGGGGGGGRGGELV